MKWDVLPLGELAASTDGAISIGPFGSAMKADSYTEAGVPVVRGTNISDTRAWKGDWVYIPDDLADRMKRCLVFADDLVLPHRGAIGEVAIIPSDERGRYFISSSLMKITLDKGKIEPLFCYYFLRSTEGRSEILRFSSSVGTPGIGQPLTSLRQFKVPVPPLPEQRVIAATLGALDDKIELNRKMNATLEAMARALFRDWFVDFGPTRAKMEARAPYLSPDLWSLFPHRLDAEGKPEGWEMRRVEQLMELAYGKALKATDRQPGNVPVYGSGGITGTHSKALVQAQSVVVGRKGTVGSLYWEDRPFFPIDTVFYVRPFVPLTFCFYALERMGLDHMNTDAAVPGLNRNNVYRILVAWPGSVIVNAFDAVVSAMRAKIKQNDEESRALAQTRDLLLPRLMSGELRVADLAPLDQETAA